jgi:hypothetical protein
VIGAVALICVIGLSPTRCFAQGGKWEPPVPANLFKDGRTEGKNPQPTHRLAPTDCDDCQKIVDQLQAALDNWYVLQLAEGKSIQIDHTDTSAANTEKEQAKNKQVSDAMAGLGQPNGKDLGAKQTQQKKDAKDKKDTHGSKDALAKEIKRLADALQECLKKCQPPTEEQTTPTPTPTPDDGKQPGTGETEKPPDLPTPVKLPAPPECFDTEAQREAFIDKWEKVCTEQNNLAQRSRIDANARQGNKQDPWYIYYQKSVEIYEKSAADLRKIIDDAADKTKTPVPCPKKGGGGSKPTPTPKGKPKKQRTTTGHNVSFDDGGAGLSEDFCALISENKIRIDDTFGTGETIGHVADLVIENLTDQPIEVTIPPMVLESRSRKNQHYGSRGGDTVEVPPHSKKKVPLDGICLARNKPPVGKDVGGDLAINDCDPDVHISHDDAHRMMRIAESKYEAADKLEEDGKLKDMPYRDPKKRKDIVVQWSTWADPRISEVTGAPPATKDDLKKVVYKQAEDQGPVTPDKKKKLDDGIDTLWDKIELTTKKAKDLEKPPPEEETTPAIPSGTSENISDDTPTPAPQTQEKKKKLGLNKKKKNWPKAIQDWIDKKNAADDADEALSGARIGYKHKLWDYGRKVSPHAKDLMDKLEDAQTKAVEPLATQADRDAADKAAKELEKQLGELDKDYQKTPEGQKEFDKMRDAEKAYAKAQEAEKAAEKNLPPGVDKEAVLREEDLKKD